MKLLLGSLAAFYLVMAPLLFARWRSFFQQDMAMSVGERSVSIVVLCLATLGWPIVVPIAYLQLLKKVQQEKTANQENSN